jgi:hypothetical protein
VSAEIFENKKKGGDTHLFFMRSRRTPPDKVYFPLLWREGMKGRGRNSYSPLFMRSSIKSSLY